MFFKIMLLLIQFKLKKQFYKKQWNNKKDPIKIKFKQK
jgi:hypothetical protein